MDDDDFWVHTITVQTHLGEGGDGPLYAPPATVRCFIDGGVKVARTATGEQVLVNAPVYAPISAQSVLLAESKVTVRGKPGRILAATIHDSGDLALPDHVELTIV